jgi:hypothetical protein
MMVMARHDELPDLFLSLLGQRLLQRRPARVGLPQHTLRIGRKGSAVFLAAEQIKPLARDQPEPGVTGIGDPTRQIDRVVASELGAVNVGMGDKARAIALIMETPDRPGLGRLEVGQADGGTGVDEIRDRVIALDGQTAEAVDHNALGGRGMGRESVKAQRAKTYPTKTYPAKTYPAKGSPEETRWPGDQGYSGANTDFVPTAVSFLPLCRHS